MIYEGHVVDVVARPNSHDPGWQFTVADETDAGPLRYAFHLAEKAIIEAREKAQTQVRETNHTLKRKYNLNLHILAPLRIIVQDIIVGRGQELCHAIFTAEIDHLIS
jgi:hypothetical protein